MATIKFYNFLVIQMLLAVASDHAKGDTSCKFPENVYTRYDWIIHDTEPPFLKELALQHGGRASFQENVVELKQTSGLSSDGIVLKSMQFVCHHAFPENKYMMFRDDTKAYICIQFIVRDLNVIQWKVSKPSETKDMKLCSKNLQLWDSPIVYYHDGFWEEPRNEGMDLKVCPLDGGYVASWTTNNSTGEMQCEGTVPPLKVENECIIGEGMWIHGLEKNEHCPMIDGILFYRLGQKHICFAHWEHENYEYMLLTMNHFENHVLCARVPRDRGEEFDMYVFPDGICHLSVNNVKYIRIHLLRHIVHGECGDESPACPEKLDQCGQMTMSSNCRETCGICVSGLRYKPQPFPHKYEGRWLRLMFNGEVETWEISGSQLHSSSMGSFTNLGVTHCSKGRNRTADGLGRTAVEFLLFSTFENGCSPRFTSLSLMNRSDSVISYKISDSQPGNIGTSYSTTLNLYTLDTDVGWVCIQNEYINDNPPLVDKYRKTSRNWFNLVRHDSEQVLVDCDFRMESLTLSYDDKTCQAHFQTTGFGRFEISASQPCSDGLELSTMQFQCLARFEGDWRRQFLITLTPGSKNVVSASHVCWITSIDKPGVLYWHPPGDCDYSTELYFNTRRHTPLATVSGDIFTSSCVQAKPHSYTILIFVIYFLFCIS